MPDVRSTLDLVVEGGVVSIHVHLESEVLQTDFLVYHVPNRLYWADGPDGPEVTSFLKEARRGGYHLTPEVIWNN